MKRGDVITVALSGDYGKPRPAVIVQSNTLTQTESVLVCLITSLPVDAAAFRLSIPENSETGLKQRSFVMTDKIVAAKREKCGKIIGRLDSATILALNQLLMFVLGVAE